MPSSERLKRQLLELSIVTLITVIIWIAYGVYAALTKPADTTVTAEELRELPPLLTAQQFDPLRDRLVISEEELERFTPFPVVGELPLPTPAPAPVASPSGESSPSGAAL